MALTLRRDETVDDVDNDARPLHIAIERGQCVGRYVILSRAGAGGMGVVYAAYDPDLDRRIALKLLHPGHERSRDGLARLLREAQAMGKLSHPNVVAVHDVGEHEGGVFLAMEFIEGRTMAAWSKACSPSQALRLAVLQQVGEGLAAAHAKGLVHRDFKPDNVLVGDDGRARVMDFGLVCLDADHPSLTTRPAAPGETPAVGLLRAGLTQSGSILGTPRYMAPEQWHGGEVGAAADQFAFCLTAYEALYGERAFAESSVHAQFEVVSRGVTRRAPRGTKVPVWLRRVLLRGLAPDPSQRWPSMSALLAAMRRDPRPRRRRIGALVALASLGVASWGAVSWDRSRRLAACEDVGAVLVRAWDTSARAQVYEAMIATGVRHASTSFDHVESLLDSYASSWRLASDTTCRASTVEGTLSPEHHALAGECLDDRAGEFHELVRLLGEPSPETVHAAVGAAVGLSGVERCTEFETMARQHAPPVAQRDATVAVRNTLAQAAARRGLGDFDGALAMALDASTQAQVLDAAVLQADAHLELGIAHLELAHYDQANAALQTAIETAGSSGADAIAAEAAQRLVQLVGSLQGRPDEGLMWGRQAQMWLDRVDAAHDDPRRALLLNARAVVIEDRGDWRDALAQFELAGLLLAATLGEDHPETAQALHNRAIVEHLLGETQAAQNHLEAALAAKEHAWGPEHPEVATTLAAYGEILVAADHRDDGIAVMRRSLAIRESAFGPDHPMVAHALYTLAHPLGPTDEAVRLLERALAINQRILGPEHGDTAMCLSELGIIAFDRGAYGEAGQMFSRAVGIIEAAFGAEHPVLGQTLFSLGRATEAAGDPRAAQVAFERAAAIVERSFGPSDRFVGDVWLTTGRGRLALGDAPGAVIALERAVTRYESVGAPHEMLAAARTALGEATTAARGATTGGK